jgi:hypothetical protein
MPVPGMQDTGCTTDALPDAPGASGELHSTEWGVASGGHVTACESEQAARALQASDGGELVSRKTWITTDGWPPARGARPREHAATRGSG